MPSADGYADVRRRATTGGLERLEWTAPEARASQQWTAKCDVYSLGLLLYRLLTGKRPHKGGVLVSPRQCVPDCPQELASALLAALHEDPKKRLDMKGLAARLADAAEDHQEQVPIHQEAAELGEGLVVDLDAGLGGLQLDERALLARSAGERPCWCWR